MICDLVLCLVALAFLASKVWLIKQKKENYPKGLKKFIKTIPDASIGVYMAYIVKPFVSKIHHGCYMHGSN